MIRNIEIFPTKQYPGDDILDFNQNICGQAADVPAAFFRLLKQFLLTFGVLAPNIGL